MPSQGAPFGVSHSAVVLMHFVSRQAPHPPGHPHVVSDSVGSHPPGHPHVVSDSTGSHPPGHPHVVSDSVGSHPPGYPHVVSDSVGSHPPGHPHVVSDSVGSHPPGHPHVVSDSVGSETGKGRLGGLSVGCGCLDYIGHKKMTFIMSIGAIEPFSYVGTHLSTRGTQRSC